VFRISMLPAHHGDCLWIEYGRKRKPHRVLIDGGPTYAHPDLLARIPDGGCRFELLVVTHVDADHIGGVLKLLTHLPADVEFGDIWFNAWKHLPSDVLGPEQGEMLSAVIERRELPWNEEFDGGAVALGEDGAPRKIELDGGLKLTLLSPMPDDLRRLRPVWKEEVEGAHMEPGSTEDAIAALGHRDELPADLLGDEGPPDPARDADKRFVEDDSRANGSSIVLLAEYRRKKILLCGDAYPSLVRRGLERLTDGRLEIEALKISHHASSKNIDNDLLGAISCERYLVSTDGGYYKHPHNAALARVVVNGGDSPILHFNYRSTKNAAWYDEDLRAEYGYSTVYPEDGAKGLTLDL
jgi:hypothetical protein